MSTANTYPNEMGQVSSDKADYDTLGTHRVDRVWYDHQHGQVNLETGAAKRTLTTEAQELHIDPGVRCYVTSDQYMTLVERASGSPLTVKLTDELPDSPDHERVGVRVTL